MTSIADTTLHPLAAARSGPAVLSAVRVWLFAIACLVFAMVLVGGATRLTGSGLSITEWQPILGVIPPQSEAAWRVAFEKYQAIPEYKLVNHAMDLQGFKTIYWWEWTHRLLGRLIGFVFLLPFIYFLARRAIPRPFIPPIAALFILGGAQGALGWFMVKSGLSDRVDVSQYRLAAHLALATVIAAYAFWLGLSIRDEVQAGRELKEAGPARLPAFILCGLIYLQIIAGAFVAGLKAGHASNTWPLMNGEVVPAGLDAYSPWYMNLAENPLTAQFTHRMIAYLVAIGIAAFSIAVWRARSTRVIRIPALALLLAVLGQIALGVATIVYDVPLAFALAHQANAIVVLALSLWTLRRATDSRSYIAASA
jgi:heme a synthase